MTSTLLQEREAVGIGQAAVVRQYRANQAAVSRIEHRPLGRVRTATQDKYRNALAAAIEEQRQADAASRAQLRARLELVLAEVG